MKKQKVWAIFYRIRTSSHSEWCNWVGPCGIHILPLTLPCEIADALRGRPFFFRTRKLAREMIEKLIKEKNTTWIWVNYCVRLIELTYKVLP